MKAAGISHQCTPGQTGADTPPRPRTAAAHTLERRAVAAGSLRCVEQSRRPTPPAAVVASTSVQPLVPLGSHWPPATAPHVLHIDNDSNAALALAVLLMPEARVTHVPTLAGARQLLQQQIFSLVVLDPDLPDGNAAELLPSLATTPLLVYSAIEPYWRERAGLYLPKPWTSLRQLWTTIANLLGIPTPTCAGD